GPTVANIVAAMKRLYDNKNLHISTDVDPRCVALCDPMDLNEMLANLIDNACKWTTDAVTVRGFLDENKITVLSLVEDTGPGLPADAWDEVLTMGERRDDEVSGEDLE